MFDGYSGSGGAGGDTELGVDRGEVRANGAGTDEEPFGDLRIGHSLSHQLQDFQSHAV